MAPLKFFSQPWCDEALGVVNGTEQVRGGLVDASSFSLALMFECTDRDGVGSRLKFLTGEVTTWTSGAGWPSDRPGARLSAALETWRCAAEGERDATLLLMERKIRLKDTKAQAMAANYRALDALLQAWGELDTDWDI